MCVNEICAVMRVTKRINWALARTHIASQIATRELLKSDVCVRVNDRLMRVRACVYTFVQMQNHSHHPTHNIRAHVCEELPLNI